ncbi:MAG: hypothetical protein U1E17_01520 [Geminicoccaceae bacterium]
MRSITWLKSSHADRSARLPGGQQGRLVDEIGEVGTEAVVIAAICSMLTSPGAVRAFLMWTEGICSRPASRRSTSTCRSKRPARRSAGSRISGPVGGTQQHDPLGRIEAVEGSVSSWLSVCCSSWLPVPAKAPRARPSASSSSMKMMAR